MKCYERFLEYVKFDTTSDPYSNTHPSTNKQFDLLNYLKTELISLGLTNVYLSDKGYLYATLPSNTTKSYTKIGFIAHVDTSCDCSGKNIKPIIHKNYDGNDIVLNKEQNIVLKVENFPFLKDKVGEDLITTDGTTLLGADDKAGIAEIISMLEYLITNDIEHGEIKVAFTPDEEIGNGADYFNIDLFDCEYAYTVDGGLINAVEYESFNAASAIVTVNGINIHPGSAKDKMINSITVAYEFNSMLPKDAIPEKTENYEGFNHLNEINGNVEKTTLNYIIRNHDKTLFENQKKDFINIQKQLNQKYGHNIIDLIINDTYYNMAEVLKDKMEIVERAMNSIRKQNLNPISIPIRGGTDGSKLSFMGLPCPNLGTGGFNCHGRYEGVSINDMNKMVDILVQIVIDTLY